jgi:hypothetical protein
LLVYTLQLLVAHAGLLGSLVMLQSLPACVPAIARSCQGVCKSAGVGGVGGLGSPVLLLLLESAQAIFRRVSAASWRAGVLRTLAVEVTVTVGSSFVPEVGALFGCMCLMQQALYIQSVMFSPVHVS